MHARRVGLTLLLCCFTPSLARAEVSDADRATARLLASEGHEAVDRKDYATAADRFARADALLHAPTLSLHLARANAALGKLVAAQELLRRVVREGVPDPSNAAFVRAVEDAKQELAALGPRIPTVIVTVKGSDAPDVTIDGTPVPRPALGAKRPVDPGRHAIRATAAGCAPAEATIELAEGASQAVALELAPATAAAGAVSPAAAPGAPAAAPPPPAPAPAHGGDARRTAGIVGVALGGAGLAFGAVLGGLAVSKHGSLASSCPDGRCDASVTQADLDAYSTVATLSTVGFVAGGVLAATGAVLWLTAPKPEGPAVGLVGGPGFVGAGGRF
jgi:hypothetical protein